MYFLKRLAFYRRHQWFSIKNKQHFCGIRNPLPLRFYFFLCSDCPISNRPWYFDFFLYKFSLVLFSWSNFRPYLTLIISKKASLFNTYPSLTINKESHKEESGPWLIYQLPELPSYRNHSIDLLCKSIDRFLYEGNTGT